MHIKTNETFEYKIKKQNKQKISLKEIIKKKFSKFFWAHLMEFNKILQTYKAIREKHINNIIIKNITFYNNQFQKINLPEINLPYNDLRNLYFTDPHMTNLIQIVGYKILMDNLWRNR